MSKQKYILRDFIAAVPSCVQTTPLAVVLDMLSCSGSDRLVVLDQDQYAIGVLHLRHLISQLMPPAKSGRKYTSSRPDIDVQQSLSEFTAELVEPVATLPADMSLEKFRLYLQSQPEQINNLDYEWTLIDSDGKYLGLLESKRLWKFLALTNAAVMDVNPPESLDEISQPSYSMEPYKLDLLVQLLERLPWPLMLQTNSGEVITQNPAWCQQFGILSDPEEVRREVEATLKTALTAAEVSEDELRWNINGQQVPLPVPESNSVKGLGTGTGLSTTIAVEQPSPKSSILEQQLDWATETTVELEAAEEKTSSHFSHCQLGNQPGSCICIWPGENGQDRVWRFLKVPLQMSVASDRFAPVQIWLLMANDVTEQQQMASELAAKNADLIQLNRLKDEFLACISHELRTPLTAMLGLSSLLKDQTLGQLNERQARYARLIHENGRHLMSVVNDILDLTRMETGQMELTLEPVQIRKVCDRAIEQARAAIQPKNSQPATNNSQDHYFTLAIEPGLESMVADELRLRQMLVHLLANAFKFTESGGEIGLKVSNWAGWIAFTVWDTGIGIPEHQQHLIFQKFQQLENPLTRQFEGTGLGLVLTRALARLHGGDVSFLSQEGKGSQFTLLLPPSPPQKRAGGAGGEIPPLTSSQSYPLTESPPLPSSQKRQNHLVLVVEAAPRFIEDLVERLTSLGCWVAIARSGTEALEKARRLQPKAIFLNPLLPLLSGWDVLTLLKSDAATSEIPVIVTTTRAEKAQALSSQADEFLSLPVTQQVLQQVMTRFCGTPEITHSSKSPVRRPNHHNQLTILRLTNPFPYTGASALTQYGSTAVDPYLSPLNCRILEADDLEQAALLARIWQPDVILLEGKILEPLTYLQKLVQYSSLAELPIVTLDAATTEAATQIEGLAVFPCLRTASELPLEKLSSVLQIAAGIRRESSILVVDVAPLVDLPKVGIEELEKHSSLLAGVKTLSYAHPSHALRAEWLQALMQYLHTAGFRGVMAHSWEEVQQQIQKQSVDLILICLGESKLALSVLKALTDLGQEHKLPPLVVMERQFSQNEVREQLPHYLEEDGHNAAPTSYSRSSASSFVTTDSETLELLETVLGAIATKILPSSLSMEELLDNIHQTLLASPTRR